MEGIIGSLRCVASTKIINVICGEVSHLLMHKLNGTCGALAGKSGRAKTKGQNSVKEKKLVTHKAQQVIVTGVNKQLLIGMAEVFFE